MLFRRSIRHLMSLPLSAAALAVSASSLFAQGRPLFDWSGRVDREVRITMHGRDARTQMAERSPFQRSRLNVETALPQRDGRVTVRVQDGRGDVDVIQQPTARNDYTTIVRVVDRSSGADNYRLTAYWMPDEYGNGTWNDRDGYPNRPDRDRDDRDNGNWGRGNGGYGGWYGRGYDRNLVRWTGDVDDALEIRIQGDRIDYRTLSGKAVRHVRADFVNGGLPRNDVQVFVTDQTGRGSVSVVQQPSSWNNYTAVIPRVRSSVGLRRLQLRPRLARRLLFATLREPGDGEA
jgi:hypothetical protein